MDKRQSLDQLFLEMTVVNLPLLDQSPLIPGDGNTNSPIIFIGEAGGHNETIQKKPFVGRAGKLLDKVLDESGLHRDSFWVTNVIKARPPENRDPLPEEIEAYRPFLERELAIINPAMIVTLGRFAMNWFLPDEKISRVHGHSKKSSSGVTIFPLYHPSAALRAGEVLTAFKADVRTLAELITGDPAIRAKMDEVGQDDNVVNDNPTQPSLF